MIIRGFRSSFDCHGRLAIVDGNEWSLVKVEQQGERKEYDEDYLIGVIKDPTCHPDVNLLLSLMSDNRGDSLLKRVMIRWSIPKFAEKFESADRGLVEALLVKDLDRASQLALKTRPWLAALLASCDDSLTFLCGDDSRQQDDDAVSDLINQIVKGELRTNDWLLDYALMRFYGSTRDESTGSFLTVPNGTEIPFFFSSVILGREIIYHPDAFPKSDLPDYLLPFLIARVNGKLKSTLAKQAFEQLLGLGLYKAASLIIESDVDRLLEHCQRFPQCRSLLPLPLQATVMASRLHSEKDYEAEFDAWILAGCLDRAAAVFIDHLADQYVLTSELMRLSARLAALGSIIEKETCIYRLYVEAKAGEDKSVAELAKLLSAKPTPKPLVKKIALSEMAAMCADRAVICDRHVPPELRLQFCRRHILLQ